MVTDEAQRRIKILAFWERHGLKATMEAFDVGRATLFEWKRRSKAGHGFPEALNPKPRAPKNRRKRIWPLDVVREIKVLRFQHPNLGKEKIHPFLKAFCEKRGLPCPSVATIGRLIADEPDKMRSGKRFPSAAGRRKSSKPQKRQRKPKGYVSGKPMECVGLDTVEFRRGNQKRYVVTLIDVHSRFAFAYGTRSHASSETARILRAVLAELPVKVEHVLTDNGSEFMRHFSSALKGHDVAHWHTYPRTPKMNAHCERFNRTLQEEFAARHAHLLFKDLPAFNRKLAGYLVWYNAKRPHRSLGMKAPIPYLLEQLPTGESRNGWARTIFWPRSQERV
jgi:transposase InsO family protein